MSSVGVAFDPADPELRRDPYPTFARLRAEDPFHRAPGGFFVVTRYADVAALLKDRSLSSAQPPGATGSPVAALAAHERSVMIAADPPVHGRRRGALAGRFSPAAIEALRPSIVARVEALLDAVDPTGPVDLVEAFSSPLAAGTLTSALGLPEADVPRLRRWAAGVLGGLEPWATDAAAAVSAAALVEISEYLAGVIEARRRAPGDDLLSVLLAAEGLDDDEVVHNAVLLVNAGLDTTADLIGGAVVALMGAPDQWRSLCEDPDDKAPAVADEAVRFVSPIQFSMRRTVAPVEVGGTRVPAESGVLLCLGSANHDDEVFAEPERFDASRSGVRHVGFGAGAHLCLGAPLARLQAASALAALASRYPSITAAGPAPWRDMVFARGPISVPVVLAP